MYGNFNIIKERQKGKSWKIRYWNYRSILRFTNGLQSRSGYQTAGHTVMYGNFNIIKERQKGKSWKIRYWNYRSMKIFWRL